MRMLRLCDICPTAGTCDLNQSPTLVNEPLLCWVTSNRNSQRKQRFSKEACPSKLPRARGACAKTGAAWSWRPDLHPAVDPQRQLLTPVMRPMTAMLAHAPTQRKAEGRQQRFLDFCREALHSRTCQAPKQAFDQTAPLPRLLAFAPSCQVLSAKCAPTVAPLRTAALAGDV
jgi:hypothetical protein